MFSIAQGIKKSLEQEIELKDKNWQEQEILQQKQFNKLHDQLQNTVIEFEREIQLNKSLKEVVEERDKLINDNQEKLQDLFSKNEVLIKDIQNISADKQKLIDNFSEAEKRFAKELQSQENNFKVGFKSTELPSSVSKLIFYSTEKNR